MIDVLTVIVQHADIDVINSIARSCEACAAHVRQRAADIADRFTRSTWIGDQSSTISVLPNGVRHGYFNMADENVTIDIRWDRGVAMSWACAWGAYTERGHRDSTHVLVEPTNGSPYIRVGNKLARCRGRLAPACINIMAGKPYATRRPLRGYRVDGEIIPDVINAWVDALLSGPEFEAGAPDRTAVKVSDGASRDIIVAAGLGFQML